LDPPAGSPTGTLLRLDETPPARTCLPFPATQRQPLLTTGASAGSRQLATAGVDAYDGQCEQVPGTYSARFDEARLREVPGSCGPFQPTIPTTTRFADLPTPFRAASACTRHCVTRAAQDIKIHYGPTFDRPTCYLHSRYCQAPGPIRASTDPPRPSLG